MRKVLALIVILFALCVGAADTNCTTSCFGDCCTEYCCTNYYDHNGFPRSHCVSCQTCCYGSGSYRTCNTNCY